MTNPVITKKKKKAHNSSNKKHKIDWDAVKLDAYEQEVSDAVNKAVDEWTFQPVENFEEMKEQLAQMAKQSRQKKKESKMVSIKRDEYQLNLIKEKAFMEWMKYQSFIKSVMFKYVTGQLK